VLDAPVVVGSLTPNLVKQDGVGSALGQVMLISPYSYVTHYFGGFHLSLMHEMIFTRGKCLAFQNTLGG